MYTAGTRHMNENKYLFGCFNACASWHSNDKYVADKILTKITTEREKKHCYTAKMYSCRAHTTNEQYASYFFYLFNHFFFLLLR